MRLLLLAVAAVGVTLILVTLILAGGRGDLGDAVRRVNLPAPRSRLPRVGLLVISVLVAACALAAENRFLSAATQAWTAALLHSAGLSTAQVAVYAPEVKPLTGALLLVSLLLFQLIRPTNVRSLAAGITVTALTGLALVLADSTVNAVAAAVGLPRSPRSTRSSWCRCSPVSWVSWPACSGAARYPSGTGTGRSYRSWGRDWRSRPSRSWPS